MAKAEMGHDAGDANSTSPRWGEVGPRLRRGPGEGVTIVQRKFPSCPPHPVPLPSPSRMFPTWTDYDCQTREHPGLVGRGHLHSWLPVNRTVCHNAGDDESEVTSIGITTARGG